MYLNFFLSEEHFSIFCSNKQGILFKKKVEGDKVVNLPLSLQSILKTINEKQITIKAITCSIGPVSFSGDRLVLAFVLGFAKALKKETYGISLFEILEISALNNGMKDFFILLDTKKDSFVLWQNGVKFVVEKTKLEKELKNFAVKNLVIMGEEANLKHGLIDNIICFKNITDEMYAKAIDVKFDDKTLKIAKEPEYIKEPNITLKTKMVKKA